MGVKPPKKKQPVKRREIKVSFDDDNKEVYDWIVGQKKNTGLDPAPFVRTLCVKEFTSKGATG